MNPQINKVANEIQKTRSKITELQTLLPELERKKMELENAEIVRLVRKAIVEPGELAGFLDSIRPHPSQVSSNSGRSESADATVVPPISDSTL